jgi:hypothetical protein
MQVYRTTIWTLGESVPSPTPATLEALLKWDLRRDVLRDQKSTW